MSADFSGFSKEAFKFFEDLEANNNRDYFQEHKPRYTEFILEPAKAFVTDLAPRLLALLPNIVAQPKVNGSIFRIQRDTRFSKDKTPYKTHIGMWFWLTGSRNDGSPGLYLHFDREMVVIGAGVKGFTKEWRDAYRQAVAGKHGEKLEPIAAKLRAKDYQFGEIGYKRVPRGFDKDHPRAEWLRYSTMRASQHVPLPKEMHSEAFLDFCEAHYANLAPLAAWLDECRAFL